MTTDREGALFLAFRSNPGPDSLVALLRGHQDHIFNICFQVLRHPQDAQDASQEVLVEVTEGIGRIENARAFKTWLYRVALHTALNHKRARSRRAELVRRKAAMDAPGIASPPEDERSAVIEALSKLDDESRCLVIEHYFDKATLEELGREQGLSTGAIWKRIERAKEKLKRALAGAGFSVAPAQVTRALESVTPVSAPAELIGELIVSKAALVAGGGITVGTKSTLSVAAVLGILICLSAGIAGGFVLLSRPTGAAQPSNAPSSGRTPEGLEKRDGTSEPLAEPGASSLKATEELPSSAHPLRTRLAGYRKKMAEEFPELAVMLAKPDRKDPEVRDYFRRLLGWKHEALAGMKDLMLSDPASILEFFRTEADGPYLEDLLQIAFAGHHNFLEFSTLPTERADGLLAMLRSGTREQKHAILEFAGYLNHKSDSFAEACRSLMSDPDSDLQRTAMEQLRMQSNQPLTDAEVAMLRRLAEDAGKPEVAGSAIRTLANKRAPGFEDFLFEIIESSMHPELVWQSLSCLSQEHSTNKKSDGTFEQRIVSAISKEVARNQLNRLCFSGAIMILLGCELTRALPVLDQAATRAPTSEWAEGARAVAEAIRSGTTDIKTLRGLLPKE